jgi:CRP-like cAMP-binding protein
VPLKQDIAVLRKIPVFAALGKDPLRLVAFSAETRIVRAGDVLFRRGEPSDGGFVVTSGMVELDPGDGRPIAEAGPGTLVGELALVIDTDRPVTATVRETGSILRIPRNVFHRVLEEFPETAKSIRELLLARAGKLSSRLSGIRDDLLAIERADQKRRKA